MRRLPSILFAAVLLVGIAPAATAGPSDAAVVANVTGTSDAAILDLQLDNGMTERIQLLGILPGAIDGTTVCGSDAATAQEQQLLASGPVTFEPADIEPTTSSASAVGYLWLADGRNLGEVLLRNGQARSLPDPAHARSQQFASAQAAAIAGQVGIWAPGACASASDPSPARAAMAGFVLSSESTVQQAQIGVNVLNQQVASAAAVGSTPSWQQTTTMAISWIRAAARTFENNAARTDPAEPQRAELALLGQQLEGTATAAETAVSAGDTAQLQTLRPQLDAENAALAGVASELNGLAVAYALGD